MHSAQGNLHSTSENNKDTSAQPVTVSGSSIMVHQQHIDPCVAECPPTAAHHPTSVVQPSSHVGGAATDQIVLALERTVREEEEEARLLRELIERTHLERQRKLDGILHDAEEAQYRVTALQTTNEELTRDVQRTVQRREQLQAMLRDTVGATYSEDDIALMESTLQTLRAHLDLERRSHPVTRRPDQIVLLLRDQFEALLWDAPVSSSLKARQRFETVSGDEAKRRLQHARANQRRLLQELSEVKSAITTERRTLERVLERRQKKQQGASNYNNSPRGAATARAASSRARDPLQRSASGATDRSGVSATRSSRAPTVRTASSGNRVGGQPSSVRSTARVGGAQQAGGDISGQRSNSEGNGLPATENPGVRGRSRSSGHGGVGVAGAMITDPDADPRNNNNHVNNLNHNPASTPLSSRRKTPMRHGEMVRELRNRLRQLQQRAQTTGRERFRVQLEQLTQETDDTLAATNQLRDRLHQETQYRMDLRDACWGLRSRVHELRADIQNVSYTALGSLTTAKPFDVHASEPALLPAQSGEECSIPYHAKVVREHGPTCHALDETMHRILHMLGRAASAGNMPSSTRTSTARTSVEREKVAGQASHVPPPSAAASARPSTLTGGARPVVLSPRRSTGSALPPVAAYPGAVNPEAARMEQMEKLVGNLKMTLYQMKVDNAAFLKKQAVRSKSSHQSSGPVPKPAHRAARMVRPNVRGVSGGASSQEQGMGISPRRAMR